MNRHHFIFQPGTYLGEGKIQMNMLQEKLTFYTRWGIPPADTSGKIITTQEIQVATIADLMQNEFRIYDVDKNHFVIELENQNFGSIVGKGFFNEKRLGWEFRLSELGFEGFEIYELEEDGSYKMHAEYATQDDFRTEIHGKIWQQKEVT